MDGTKIFVVPMLNSFFSFTSSPTPAASTIEEFSDGQKRKISHLLEEEDEMSPANEEPTKMQKTSHTFYIKLADESLHEEENQGGLSSDDATYDSTYHDRETGKFEIKFNLDFPTKKSQFWGHSFITLSWEY